MEWNTGSSVRHDRLQTVNFLLFKGAGHLKISLKIQVKNICFSVCSHQKLYKFRKENIKEFKKIFEFFQECVCVCMYL